MVLNAPPPGHDSFDGTLSDHSGGDDGGATPTKDNEMPEDLIKHLHELELWAQANQKESKNDAIAFWALKIPAICTSVGSGILAYFDLQVLGLIFGFVAGACVIIDGIHPRGMLRNVHLRAFHDIRILTTGMITSWRTRNSRANDNNTSKRIIKDSENERKKIANYLKEAETAFEHKKET